MCNIELTPEQKKEFIEKELTYYDYQMELCQKRLDETIQHAAECNFIAEVVGGTPASYDQIIAQYNTELESLKQALSKWINYKEQHPELYKNSEN